MTREEAINILQHLAEIVSSGDYQETFKMAVSDLRPVSRERVILCKDCQYWQGNNGGYPHPECRWGNNETPDEDDYCSFAKRLEVSKNG